VLFSPCVEKGSRALRPIISERKESVSKLREETRHLFSVSTEGESLGAGKRCSTSAAKSINSRRKKGEASGKSLLGVPTGLLQFNVPERGVLAGSSVGRLRQSRMETHEFPYLAVDAEKLPSAWERKELSAVVRAAKHTPLNWYSLGRRQKAKKEKGSDSPSIL